MWLSPLDFVSIRLCFVLLSISYMKEFFMSDQKGMIHIEIKKEERVYTFVMPMGSPIGECYDAAHEVLNTILEMGKQATEQTKREEKKTDKKEEEVAA